FSFGEYCLLLKEGNWPAIANLLTDSCSKLGTLGADFAICPDNTVHEAMEHASLEATLPWIHIAEVVAREAHTRGLQRLAILGTRYLMEGPVYPAKLAPLGIKTITPNADERSSINTLIFDHLVFNRVTREDRSTLLNVIERLHDEHQCDAVVLGCTELPLILNDTISPLPTLDSTRLLARAAIKRAATRD
ncbi:MAG: amino acid racemase, partial [Verrucomicrobiota bacterium]|nr:amino acid racemase [Verrucomicrobiota bacterium]